MKVLQVFTWDVKGCGISGAYNIVADSVGESSKGLRELLSGSSFKAHCASAPGYGLQVS